ncbi:MAG: T9SS type A sorting domain-containing protein, partial [Sediminibacterium sp.]
VDMSTGKALDNLFDASTKKYKSRNNGYNAYQSSESKDEDEQTKLPLGGSVACLAFDAKSNRLFYVPLQLSELRYMDLKESDPSFTCLTNQSINLLHGKDDVANQITRMAIGADGFGYALSNDGEHLIKFTTQGTPVIQDLGVLIDNPKNPVFVRSSCTSWGGDMVAGADGNLYLIALHNHVFKISMPSKKCDYIGTIKNLPEEFTSNGASVDENGELLISCGTTYGKKFSPVYKVKWPSLEATAVDMHINNLGNISDMASSNLLFQKATKAVENSVSFNQTIDIDVVNTPGISIFPNPINHGRFQVRTSNLKEKGEYRMILLDVNGKAIIEAKMNLNAKVNTNSFTIPAQHAKGVYFVQIADVFNRTIYSQQLIVE